MSIVTLLNFNTLIINLIKEKNMILEPSKVTAKPIKAKGSKYLHCIVIKLDDIYVQPQENNLARVDTKDAFHIQKLIVNLSNGINYGLTPSIARENPRVIDGVTYRYELVCGHHRFEALKSLDITEWVYWVYDFGLDGYTINESIIYLQIEENDHVAALASSSEDVSAAIIHLIRNNAKLVENTEDSICDFVNQMCKNMHHNTKAKVVRQVMSKLNTYQRIVTFTAKDSFSWIEKHTDYEKAGNYDTKRQKIGWSVLEGYEPEFIFNAISKYAETGKESYFICRTKAPTKARDLDVKRKGMIKSFEKLNDSLLTVFEYFQKNGKFPWQVEAFIPQNTENEDKTKVVKV